MRFGPAVRLLIHQHGLNPGSIIATGPHGTLLKSDVLAVIRGGGVKPPPFLQPATPSPAASKPSMSTAPKPPKPSISLTAPTAASKFVDLTLDSAQKAFGASLVTAKMTAPHAYQTVEIDMSRLDTLLQSITKREAPPNFNHYLRVASLLKTTSRSVRTKFSSIQGLNSIDVSVSIRDPSGHDRVVNMRNVAGCDVAELATLLYSGEVENLPKSMFSQQDSASVAFHVSSSQDFVRRSQPVVRPPQICAFSVAQQALTLVPGESSPKIAPIFSICMSYDSSKMDDADAAQLLSAIAFGATQPGL